MTDSIIKTMKFSEGIQASLPAENTVTLKGPKGTLTREFKTHLVTITQEGNNLVIVGTPKNKHTDKLVETTVAHLRNMSEGLVYGYKYHLKVLYSHFPMTIAVDKDMLSIKNFLGEKFPRKVRIMGLTKVEVKGQDVTVSGISKDDVGQTASNMELKTKVKGKDIRRYQDGIYIVEMGNIETKKGKPMEIIRGRV